MWCDYDRIRINPCECAHAQTVGLCLLWCDSQSCALMTKTLRAIALILLKNYTDLTLFLMRSSSFQLFSTFSDLLNLSMSFCYNLAIQLLVFQIHFPFNGLSPSDHMITLSSVCQIPGPISELETACHPAGVDTDKWKSFRCWLKALDQSTEDEQKSTEWHIIVKYKERKDQLFHFPKYISAKCVFEISSHKLMIFYCKVFFVFVHQLYTYGNTFFSHSFLQSGVSSDWLNGEVWSQLWFYCRNHSILDIPSKMA